MTQKEFIESQIKIYMDGFTELDFSQKTMLKEWCKKLVKLEMSEWHNSRIREDMPSAPNGNFWSTNNQFDDH